MCSQSGKECVQKITEFFDVPATFVPTIENSKIPVIVIIIARVLGIYGSKPNRVRGRSPRTRAVYVALHVAL